MSGLNPSGLGQSERFKNTETESVSAEETAIGPSGDEIQFSGLNIADDYFVNSTAGSDDAEGTNDDPLATVAEALDRADTDYRGRGDNFARLRIVVKDGHVEPEPVVVKGFVGRIILEGEDDSTAIKNKSDPPYIPILKYQSLAVTDSWLAKNIKVDRLTVRGSTGGAIGNIHATGDSSDGYRNGAIACESAEVDIYDGENSQTAGDVVVGTADASVDYGLLAYREEVRCRDLDVISGQEPDRLARAYSATIKWRNVDSISAATNQSPKIVVKDGGEHRFGNGVGAVAYRSGTQQSISSGAVETVQFNSIKTDPSNSFDDQSYKYVVPAPGLYEVTSGLVWDSDGGWSTGDRIAALIKVNGDTTLDFYGRKVTTQAETITATGVYERLERGDEITVGAFQDSGAAQELRTDSGSPRVKTFISISRVDE